MFSKLLLTFSVVYLAVFCQPIFGQSGFKDPNVSGIVNAIALQEDGKIVIGGGFTSVGGQPRTFLARLNAGGTLDATFQNPGLNGQGIFSLAVQQDGKIIVGGDFRVGANALNIARFNPDGSLDLTFNVVTNGIVWAILPQSDGRIFIGGEFSTVSGQARMRMALLNSVGGLDTTFPDAGFASTSGIPSVVYAISQQTDGKLLVGGYFNVVSGQNRTAVARLNSDGSPDNTFLDPAATGGTGTTIQFLGNQTIVNSIAIQPDGKILISGAVNSVGGQARNNLARLNSDGTLDVTFQNPGITNLVNAFTNSISLQTDGRILVAGWFNAVAGQGRLKVARVNADGTLDVSFADPLVSDGFVRALALQGDAKILIGGAFTSVGGRVRKSLTRLNSDGTLDIPPSQVFTVTKIADTNDGLCNADCSLREAIAAANSADSNDVIQFDPSVFSGPQTIALTNGQLSICNNGSVTINGTSADQLTISGSNLSRILRVFPGGMATLNNITLANGKSDTSPGAGCPAQSGIDSGFGGGAIESAGTLFINNSVLRNNMATGSGGAITNSYGKVTITNSSIHDNQATDFGGIGNFGFGTSLPVTMTIENSQVTNNTSLGANTNGGGGLGNVSRGTMTIINSVVSENTTANVGGGIFNDGSFLTLTNTTINSNTAAKGAGGVANNTTGTVSVVGSTISGNAATIGSGGGIRNFGSTIAITNSTISGNMGPSGGGVYGGNLDLRYATIAFNLADTCGGVCGPSGITSRSSIIGSNVANTFPDFSGELTSLGYNLISNSSGLTIVGGSEDILNVNPRLAPLASNGGPTLTHALLINSAAIDKGGSIANVNIDQRGQPRVIDNPSTSNASGGDGSDIGAFEAPKQSISFDFDGDGKTDIGITRPNSGIEEWWISRSSDSNVFATVFGVPSDIPTPGDFTGDGKTDIALFRPSTGQWFVLRSDDFSYLAFPFGTNGDIPMPADYDGDGKTDPAVFRPSQGTWFISRTSDNQTTIAQFGVAGDKPVSADYDGDGKADMAVYRLNNGAEEWWVQRSSAGLFATVFGVSGDKAVPEDYTGDGKVDVAVWRPSNGNWFILRSEDLSFLAFPWGANGDLPAPGDYDGDGKTDAAVFRASQSTWFINRTGGQGPLITSFGASTDSPVAGAYVR